MAESMFGEFDGLKVGAYPDNAEVIRERTLEAFHTNFPGSEITVRRSGVEQEAHGYTFVYKQIVEVDDLTLAHGAAAVSYEFWPSYLHHNRQLFKRAVSEEGTDVDKEQVWRKLVETLVGLKPQGMGPAESTDAKGADATLNLSPVGLAVPRFEDAAQLSEWRPFLDLYGFKVLEREFEPPRAVPDLDNPKLFDGLFIPRNPIKNFWHILSSTITPEKETIIGEAPLRLNPISSAVPTAGEIKAAHIIGTLELTAARLRLISREGYSNAEKYAREERDRAYRAEEQAIRDRQRRTTGYRDPRQQPDDQSPADIIPGEGYSYGAGSIGGP